MNEGKKKRVVVVCLTASHLLARHAQQLAHLRYPALQHQGGQVVAQLGGVEERSDAGVGSGFRARRPHQAPHLRRLRVLQRGAARLGRACARELIARLPLRK